MVKISTTNVDDVFANVGLSWVCPVTKEVFKVDDTKAIETHKAAVREKLAKAEETSKRKQLKKEADLKIKAATSASELLEVAKNVLVASGGDRDAIEKHLHVLPNTSKYFTMPSRHCSSNTLVLASSDLTVVSRKDLSLFGAPLGKYELQKEAKTKQAFVVVSTLSSKLKDKLEKDSVGFTGSLKEITNLSKKSPEISRNIEQLNQLTAEIETIKERIAELKKENKEIAEKYAQHPILRTSWC